MNMNTSIIIITANEYDEDLEKSGLGYIQKPINRETIRVLLGSSLIKNLRRIFSLVNVV